MSQTTNVKLPKIFRKRAFYISLFSVILLVSLFFLALPYMSGFWFNLNKPDPTNYEYAVSRPELLVPNNESLDDSEFLKDVKDNISGKSLPDRNRLVIPKIGVDAAILEGSSLDVLDREEGVWREPFTGTLDEPSNMVLAGHRFQYLPPNQVTFYHLDKLETGDKILVYWKDSQGEMRDYVFEVYKEMLVEPKDIYVRNHNPNNGREVTLYTCGPEVGENSKRIVVKAKQVV